MPQPMNARQRAAAQAAKDQAKFEAEVKRQVKLQMQKNSPIGKTPAQKARMLQRGLP
jgi:hypothetical protein